MEHYPHDVVFDLFVIYGENNGIANGTCRAFNLKYPNLPQMTKGKFIRMKNNFCDYRKVVNPVVRIKPVTEHDEVELTLLDIFKHIHVLLSELHLLNFLFPITKNSLSP
jgi:hypothetical protein